MHARQFPHRSTPPPPPGPVQRWNTRLTDWKPLLLLTAGGIYAAGYGARAVHAWDSSLGILPALDFQYFVAGVFLLVPLGVLGLVVLSARGVLRRWVAAERLHKNWRERTDQVLAAMTVGGIFLFGLILGLGRLGVHFERFAVVLPYISVIGFFILLVLNIARGDDGKALPIEADAIQVRSRPRGAGAWIIMIFGSLGLFSSWLAGITILLGIALFVVVVPLFGVVLLPHWPQELGGAMPRCQVLDVEVKRLSPQLAGDLFDGAVPPLASEVRRTRELAVHFSNSEFMIIRLPASPGIRSRTLELKRAAVVATMSCSERLGQSP
jgi:hypothetical protein